MPAKITKTMTLGEIARKFPQTVEVMYSHGMHCPTCPAAAMESLENGAAAHGMNRQQMEKMLKEMNAKVKKK